MLIPIRNITASRAATTVAVATVAAATVAAATVAAATVAAATGQNGYRGSAGMFLIGISINTKMSNTYGYIKISIGI
jgi:hypothetical protein